MNCNPVLVKVNRGSITESFHRGAICVVNHLKEPIYSQGDIHQLCYPRSSMKFFQQIPLLALGGAEKFDLSLEEIAILCGSHNGEKQHVETVQKILNKGGFTEEDLECGPQEPTLKKDKIALYKQNIKPSKLHNNCSGKHAGFLLLCKLLNIPNQHYSSPEHKIQKMIADTCSRFYETPLEAFHYGIDGCSAPIFAFTVYKQAVAYLNLIHPMSFSIEEQKACKMLLEAVQKYPFMIAGTNRYCSELMEITGTKVVGKTGADGVYCLGIPDKKLGISIKIDDGKMGPQYTIAQALLNQSGLLSKDESSKLKTYVEQENYNFGGIVCGNTSYNKEINLNLYNAE